MFYCGVYEDGDLERVFAFRTRAARDHVLSECQRFSVVLSGEAWEHMTRLLVDLRWLPSMAEARARRTSDVWSAYCHRVYRLDRPLGLTSDDAEQIAERHMLGKQRKNSAYGRCANA